MGMGTKKIRSSGRVSLLATTVAGTSTATLMRLTVSEPTLWNGVTKRSMTLVRPFVRKRVLSAESSVAHGSRPTSGSVTLSP